MKPQIQEAFWRFVACEVVHDWILTDNYYALWLVIFSTDFVSFSAKLLVFGGIFRQRLVTR